jgi:hypothetical protein
VKKFLRRFRVGIGAEAIVLVLSVLLFFLVEDMRLPMVLIDRWTPVFLFLLFCTWIVDVRLARYREKIEEEDAGNDSLPPGSQPA